MDRTSALTALMMMLAASLACGGSEAAVATALPAPTPPAPTQARCTSPR